MEDFGASFARSRLQPGWVLGGKIDKFPLTAKKARDIMITPDPRGTDKLGAKFMRVSSAASTALVLILTGALSACGESATTEASDAGADAAAMAEAGPDAWQEYSFPDLKLAKRFPVEPTRMEGTYWDWPLTEREPEVAGEAPSVILSASADNIDYEVTVVPLPDRAHMGASIMGECAYLTEESGVEQKNTSIEIQGGDHPVYGHQVVVDRHDGMGRLYNGCYFENGTFYLFSATVRPEHGGLEAREAEDFVTSGGFLTGA